MFSRVFACSQSRNWKLTESLEELGVLREKSEEARKRVEEVEEVRDSLQTQLQEERTQHQDAVDCLTQEHQLQTQVCKACNLKPLDDFQQCKGI